MFSKEVFFLCSSGIEGLLEVEGKAVSEPLREAFWLLCKMGDQEAGEEGSEILV